MCSGVLRLFVWIYLQTLTVQTFGSVCPSGNNGHVVTVCTASVISNVSQAFIDTSSTPSHTEATCECKIVVPAYNAAVGHRVSVSFVKSSYVSKTSFKFLGSIWHTLAKSSDNITVSLLLGGRKTDISYFQPLHHTDLSCLNITAVSSGLSFNIDCSDAVIVQPTTTSVRASTTSGTTTTAARDISSTTGIIDPAHLSSTPSKNEDVTKKPDGDGNTTPIVAGVVGGIIAIIAVVVVVCLLQRKRIDTHSKPQEDNSQSKEVASEAFKMEGTYNEVRKSCHPGDNNVDESRGSGDSTHDYTYTLPDDDMVKSNEDTYTYIIPEKGKAQMGVGDPLPPNDDYSYSMISNQNNSDTSNNATLKTSTKPTLITSGRHVIDENVYDHTFDKEPVVTTNEYGRLENVPGRDRDCLNTYDTTGHVTKDRNKNDSETSGHYDKTS